MKFILLSFQNEKKRVESYIKCRIVNHETIENALGDTILMGLNFAIFWRFFEKRNRNLEKKTRSNAVDFNKIPLGTKTFYRVPNIFISTH